MTQNDDVSAPKSASEKLAELSSGETPTACSQVWPGITGQRQSERLAAAHSLSRSKPASRK